MEPFLPTGSLNMCEACAALWNVEEFAE
jgi:hypothetical protein